MGLTLAEAFVVLKGNDSRLKSDLAKAETDTKRAVVVMQNSADGLKHSWNGVGAALGSVGAAAVAALGAGAMIEAAQEAETAQVDLASALARTGDASMPLVEKFRAFAEELEKVTTYSHVTTEAAMAHGKNLGIETNQLEAATKAAMGLAARYKLDLNQAMTLIGRASQGNTAMLKRFGIQLDEGGTKAQKFAQLLRIGMAGFPMAEAAARTAAGRFAQFKNELAACAEKIGGMLLPAFVGFMALAKPLIALLNGMPAPVKALVLVMGGLALLLPTLIKLWNFFADAEKRAAIASTALAVAQWALKNPALAGIVAAGIFAATVAVSAAISDSEKDTKDYVTSINKLMAGIKGVDVGDSGPAETDPKALTAAQEKQKADAKAAQDAISDTKKRYTEQANSVLDIYKNLKAAREEDEKRQRVAIGWKGLTDIWKGAVEAGATARFSETPRYSKGWYGASGVASARPNAPLYEDKLMREAMSEFRQQTDIQKATLRQQELIADALTRGASL
jgi:hypothetical protein